MNNRIDKEKNKLVIGSEYYSEEVKYLIIALKLFIVRSRKTNMKTIIFLAAIVLLCIIASSNAKRLFYDNDNDMELTDKKAQMFLRAITGENEGDDDGDDDDDSSLSLDTRAAGQNCVPCKFGVSPCCAPNICRKKRFRPDECLEIKQGK